MKLSEFNKQRQQQGQGTNDPTGGRSGSWDEGQIQDFVPYQRGGIRCLLNTGEEVTVTGSGNVPGMSPVKEHINAEGKFEAAQTGDYTVIDRDYLPHATQQLQQVEQPSNLRRERQR